MQAHISALQQELVRLRSSQKDFEQATASLEHCRQMHASDRQQILKLEETVKACIENEQHYLIIKVR